MIVQDLVALCQDWVKPPPGAAMSLRIPIQYVSFQAAVCLLHQSPIALGVNCFLAIGARRISMGMRAITYILSCPAHAPD